MNQAVAKLINEQINKEFYSAYLYLDFANYYAQVGLDVFENWYKAVSYTHLVRPCRMANSAAGHDVNS